jgi:hypothetical protein
MIFDFVRRWKVACAMSRATDNAEGLPIERMARIQNLDDLDQ